MKHSKDRTDQKISDIYAEQFILELCFFDYRTVGLRWPGDSQRTNQFARFDSQRNPYFHSVQAIRVNHLKPATRHFCAPTLNSNKKKGSVREP